MDCTTKLFFFCSSCWSIIITPKLQPLLIWLTVVLTDILNELGHSFSHCVTTFFGFSLVAAGVTVIDKPLWLLFTPAADPEQSVSCWILTLNLPLVPELHCWAALVRGTDRRRRRWRWKDCRRGRRQHFFALVRTREGWRKDGKGREKKCNLCVFFFLSAAASTGPNRWEPLQRYWNAADAKLP